MATMVELIGVSVKPIVGKELSAKDLLRDRFLKQDIFVLWFKAACYKDSPYTTFSKCLFFRKEVI